jgi:sulfide:quinone oxidoreductase
MAGGRPYAYDYLIIALGADLAMEGIPDLADGAYHYYDLAGAQRLWEALRQFSGGRVVLSIAGTPYKCPAAPHEGALLIEAYLRARGLRSRSEVDLYTPEPQPMPVAGPVLGEAVRRQLEERGIGFHPRQRLVAVQAAARRIVLEGGEEVTYDLLVAIPPHRCPAVVREAGLTDESGWLPVDAHTLEARVPGVFALGDVAAVRLPNGMFLPKAGVFAHGQGEAVARRIAASISGGEAPDFDGQGFCWLETGDGAAAFAAGRFYAEPQPEISLRPAGRLWHWGKVLFERYWLDRWPGRTLLRPLLQAGASLMRIPGQV